MVAFRSLLATLAVPFLFSQTVLGASLSEREITKEVERRAALNGNGCATVNLSLLGLSIANGVCICIEAGVITPASALQIGTLITAKGGLLAGAVNSLGGLTNAVTNVGEAVAPIIIQNAPQCSYPANSSPTCGSCTFACDDGYKQCNGACILNADTCISSRSMKRNYGVDSGNHAQCPIGYEACMVPTITKKAVFDTGAFECIKTASDLESCGGCAYPLPGRPTGQDCSAIANVGSATCQAGKCVIDTCMRGFTFNGVACVQNEGNGRKLSGYWAALEESSKMILQK